MRGVVGMEQDNTLRVWVKSLSLENEQFVFVQSVCNKKLFG